MVARVRPLPPPRFAMLTCPSCRTSYPDAVDTCPTDGERLLPEEAFASADADLTAGETVGEYRIEEKIGAGGFGTVYRAVHPLIGKAVAIKVLSRQYSSNPQMVSRFIAEARAVNQIRQRNIIDIFSFGSLGDGRQYYVMELLEGLTLDRYIKQNERLAPDVAIPILRGIAKALDAAHAAGIAHRDLKPENVFLVFDDDGGVFPKLLDFGIAKLSADAAASHKTRTGAPIGTPYYMSPEQCRGKNVDHRTDIYSFGVLSHETLTGRLPFTGESVMDIMLKQTMSPAPSLSSVIPSLPAALDGPVLRMLDKDPANRPKSLTEAVDELATAAAGVGYAVRVPSARSGDLSRSGGAVVSISSGPVTPLDLELAEARTMVQGAELSGKTLRGSETDVAPSSGGRRRVVYVAVAALLVGVGIAVSFTLARPSRPPPRDAVAAQPQVSVSAHSEPPEPPEPDASAEPAASSAVVVAPAPAEVELTIQSSPEAVEVFLGDEKLGVAPGPIRLPRADEKIALSFRAAGYRAAEVEVTPSASGVVSVSLQKVAAAQPPPKPRKPPTSGEIENPF